MRVTEPVADLAVAVAVASVVGGYPVPAGAVVLGEVGLAGEVRRVTSVGRRLAEAQRLGFTAALVPPEHGPIPDGIRAYPCATVDDAIRKVVVEAGYKVVEAGARRGDGGPRCCAGKTHGGAGCTMIETTDTSLQDLPFSSDLAELRTRFNADRGKVRLLMLLSPTCPMCVGGASVVQMQVLATVKSPDVRAYAVWVPILDSKWTVENGALISRQDPNGRREGESWLVTEKHYQDFLLNLRFRITPGGNSGVFLRDPLSTTERLNSSSWARAPPADCAANESAAAPVRNWRRRISRLSSYGVRGQGPRPRAASTRPQPVKSRFCHSDPLERSCDNNTSPH